MPGPLRASGTSGRGVAMTDGGAAFQPGQGEPGRSGRGARMSGTRCSATVTAPCSWSRRSRATCGRPPSSRARSGGSPAGCSTGAAGPTTRAGTWWSTASLSPGRARTGATASPATGTTRSRCRTRTCGCCGRTPPGCTRPPSRWAGGGRSPGPASSARRDFATQGELVGPGGVGLLVFGSGLDWGTAYLGPGGQVPGSARSFIPVPRPVPEALPSPARELGPAARHPAGARRGP